MKKYVLVIDQGTTSSRVCLVDKFGEIKYLEQMPLNIYDLGNGAIRQNASEILETVNILIERIFKKNNISPSEIVSIGIANQRESVVIWDKKTKEPLFDVISWQSKETQDITDKWIEKGLEEEVREKTGLTINPYFSASKIYFLLNKVKKDDVLVGTIDSFLLYNLSKESNHYTSTTNAARTMLYNIKNFNWDNELLNKFGIPLKILPKVLSDDAFFGTFSYQGENIKIRAMLGDQQASLIGHQCFEPGMVKNTYGTGAFILFNLGEELIYSKKGLLTTIAYKLGNKITYALEGSIFICGAALEWLKEEISLIKDTKDIPKLVKKAKDDSIYFVPAFVGLGTPYWDLDVRGAFFGLKRKTQKEDLVKAVLNSISFQVEDVLNLLRKESKLKIKELATDGGATNNEYMLQFQSNISNCKVIKMKEKEITALGAAYIAGLAEGFYEGFEEISKYRQIGKIFYPRFEKKQKEKFYKNWQMAIKAARLFKVED